MNIEGFSAGGKTKLKMCECHPGESGEGHADVNPASVSPLQPPSSWYKSSNAGIFLLCSKAVIGSRLALHQAHSEWWCNRADLHFFFRNVQNASLGISALFTEIFIWIKIIIQVWESRFFFMLGFAHYTCK